MLTVLFQKGNHVYMIMKYKELINIKKCCPCVCLTSSLGFLDSVQIDFSLHAFSREVVNLSLTCFLFDFSLFSWIVPIRVIINVNSLSCTTVKQSIVVPHFEIGVTLR